MKIPGVVVLYYPSDQLSENIQSYIEGVDKLLLGNNTPVENINQINIKRWPYLN